MTKAAGQGAQRAQFNLGALLSGGSGVSTDFVESYTWFDIATSRDPDPEARKQSADARDQVAKRLTPGEIADARKRASEWIEAFKKRQDR